METETNLPDMTTEEKEREYEILFLLFERLHVPPLYLFDNYHMTEFR